MRICKGKIRQGDTSIATRERLANCTKKLTEEQKILLQKKMKQKDEHRQQNRKLAQRSEMRRGDWIRNTLDVIESDV